jgi:hypothetical protein
VKYIIIAFLLSLTSNAFTQNDVAFKVVSFSNGVTIDGAAPTIGENVTKDKKHIEVPAGGYLGGITADGNIFKITQSSNVNRVMANSQVRPEQKFYYVYPQHITVSSVSKANRIIAGDSLFLNWKVDQEDADDSTTIKVSDILYQEIASVKVKNNYVLLDIAPLLNQYPNVVLELMCDVTLRGCTPAVAHSGLLGLQRPNGEQLAAISFDLQRLPQTSDRLFYESALYLLNDFTYDSSVCLYKILRSKQTTNDPLLRNFFDWLTKKYDLHQIKLD